MTPTDAPQARARELEAHVALRDLEPDARADPGGLARHDGHGPRHVGAHVRARVSPVLVDRHAVLRAHGPHRHLSHLVAPSSAAIRRIVLSLHLNLSWRSLSGTPASYALARRRLAGPSMTGAS